MFEVPINNKRIRNIKFKPIQDDKIELLVNTYDGGPEYAYITKEKAKEIAQAILDVCEEQYVGA